MSSLSRASGGHSAGSFTIACMRQLGEGKGEEGREREGKEGRVISECKIGTGATHNISIASSQANLLKGYVPWSVGDTPSCPLHHKHMSHKCQTLHSLVHCPLQLERLPSPNPLVNSQHGLGPTVLNPPPQSFGTEPQLVQSFATFSTTLEWTSTRAHHTHIRTHKHRQ